MDACNRKIMMKFVYSYGGRIVIRRADGKLRYAGGHTRILAVNRSISFEELTSKFSKLCGSSSCSSSSVRIKCKLPEDDLDLLVSVKCDEDLAYIVQEYERFSVHTHKESTKIRAILLPMTSQPSTPPPMNVAANFRFINGYDVTHKGVCKRFLSPPLPPPSRFAVNVMNQRCQRFPVSVQICNCQHRDAYSHLRRFNQIHQ